MHEGNIFMSMELVPKVACQKHEISSTFDFLILKMQGNYLHMIFPKLLVKLIVQEVAVSILWLWVDLIGTPLCLPRGRWYVYPSASAQL